MCPALRGYPYRGNTTGHGFGLAILALWFLLLVALAGPHREKPHSSSRINAGTAEPVRVSPPEAVAYPLELVVGDQEVEQSYGVQAHHLLCCDALDLDRSWYTAPSAQKSARGIQTP